MAVSEKDERQRFDDGSGGGDGFLGGLRRVERVDGRLATGQTRVQKECRHRHKHTHRTDQHQRHLQLEPTDSHAHIFTSPTVTQFTQFFFSTIFRQAFAVQFRIVFFFLLKKWNRFMNFNSSQGEAFKYSNYTQNK